MTQATQAHTENIERLIRERALRNVIRQFAEELSALHSAQEIVNAFAVVAGEIVTQEI